MFPSHDQGGLDFGNVKILRFEDYYAGLTGDSAGTISTKLDTFNGNILEIAPQRKLYIKDSAAGATFDIETQTTISGSVILSSSLDVTGSTNITGSLKVTGSYNGTGNLTAQSITANGFLYSATGNVTSGTGIQAGYNGSGGISIQNSSNTGNQFGTFTTNMNSTTFAGHYGGYTINDVNSTGSYATTALEQTAYSGLDNPYPVIRLNMGPNNGTTGNTVMWTSKNYPWMQFSKQVNFLSPVTSSADVMVSASKVLELQPVGTLNATAPTGSLQVSSSGEIFIGS